MTFTFKLARRLALGHVGSLALLASAACADAGTPTGPVGDDPASPAPSPVVQLAPEAPTVEVGRTVRFEAFARHPDGDSLPIDVRWSVSGGSIAPDGSFSAALPGAYTVVALDSARARADTTQVTVVAPPSPVAEGKMPAGFTLLTSRRFDAKVEDGWTDRGDAGFSIVQKADAPRSASNVGQALFAEGFPSGSGPISTSYLMSGRTRLYVDFTLQLSSNWDGNDAGVNKIFFVWMHDDPSVCVSATGVGDGPLIPQIRLQNTPMGSVNLSPNRDLDARIVRGRWQRWELVLVANTPGRADGEAHWWVDGVRVGEHTGLTFAGAGQANTWDRFSWNPTYGGAGDPVPYDQFMWMDHIALAAP